MATLSPFRFAGSKNKLIPILMEHIGPLLQNKNDFAEPFIGGGSVGLSIAKNYPNVSLHFNDKDEWVSNFWRVVSGDYNKLQDLLTMLDQPASIEQFNKLNETSAITDIDKAYRAMYYNRTCFSGIVKRDKNNIVISSPIGGKNQLSAYKVNCRYNGKKLKEKIIDCHRLLSGRTVVDNMDVNDYLLKIDNNIPIYLDPPYRKVGIQLYNEYMDDADHIKLVNSLKLKSKWVLSYDDDNFIKELYKDNKIIDLAARYSIQGAKKNWSSKNELIILGD